MEEDSKKIFVVTGKFSNSLLSRGRNFGDDYGETYPFTEHVVADSPEYAIARVQQTFDDYIARYREGRRRGTRSIREPNVPRNVKNWEVKELIIPGYHIILEKCS